MGLEKHEISNHNYSDQNHAADVEATLDTGKTKLFPQLYEAQTYIDNTQISMAIG